jgi:hypothetical protein
MSNKEVEFLVKLRDAHLMAADAVNEYIESKAPAGVKENKQTEKTELPGSEKLKNLPWKSYKTKEAAAPEEAGWIFADTQGAEALLSVLKTKDKTVIENFEYSRSGNENQFISRKPLKSKA